ncbi:MAG TPA: MFS transporter [Candidatus Saccharimonadales bacterium]|nr:MFS transporter [Candidatus Saccharimonadales bacterium]
MKSQRWLRIIPVALIMYTISYVDRTNVNMALTPRISSLMKDLFMDDRMKGEAAGIFFFGYVLLQIPGGHLATRWSARKVISLCLIAWGICAVACGLAHSFRQFEVARFFLGVAESGVFPSMLVLLANWFPRSERARANAYWNLCQPLAVVVSALLTGALLESHGWRTVIILEGALPFIWLPIWWFFIRDKPRQANWISAEEREYLETALSLETAAQEPPQATPLWKRFGQPFVVVMIAINFLHNALAYGCMAFFTSSIEGKGFSALQYGMLFALPYTFTAVLMVLVSRHSDKTNERRMHIALTYVVSGLSLILSVSLRGHFWLSYAFLCLSIPGPSVALAPFWAIPSETLPTGSRGAVIGLVNACGNLGGFVGPSIAGWLKQKSGSLELPFDALGIGILIAAGLACLLPKPIPNPPKANI